MVFAVLTKKIASQPGYWALLLTLFISALILLFPSLSGLAVFSRSNFSYPESIGFVLLYLTFLLIILNAIFNQESIKKINIRFKFALLGLILAISVFLLLIIISFSWIRFEVKATCIEAKKQYGGQCVEALTNLIEDENSSLLVKNKAIWTLGQLADSKALPILKDLYTGEIPYRESLYTTLSQYELQKAIRWCEQGNITSWMYADQNRW